MDTGILKNNLIRIIKRGRYRDRTVDVAVLGTCLKVVEENERLKAQIARIEGAIAA